MNQASVTFKYIFLIRYIYKNRDAFIFSILFVLMCIYGCIQSDCHTVTFNDIILLTCHAVTHDLVTDEVMQ
jgi:hypothetical protein